MVYAENEEIIENLFDANMKKFLNDNPKAVELIHITDRKTFLNSPLAIKMNFILHNEQDMPLTAAMSQLTMKLVDKLKSFRPSQKAKDASDKNRLGYEAVVAKDEDKEEENRARIAKAKEDKFNSMTAEEKVRARELDEKRANKKMIKKFKVR